jgi:hypothetical protein
MRLLPEADIRLLETDCCGLGGLYGFKTEKFAITEEVVGTWPGDRRAQTELIVTDCEGCRMQLRHLTGSRSSTPSAPARPAGLRQSSGKIPLTISLVFCTITRKKKVRLKWDRKKVNEQMVFGGGGCRPWPCYAGCCPSPRFQPPFCMPRQSRKNSHPSRSGRAAWIT